MDEHNVHHFWGISPALDLGSLLETSGTGDGPDAPVDQPLRILQVAPYDARHTLTTICRAARHPLLERQTQPVQLYVWEDSPEGLCRHLLLLAVALDGALQPRERGELLLELHGNALCRERAAAYLDEKARQLEALVVAVASGAAVGQAPAAGGAGAGAGVGGGKGAAAAAAACGCGSAAEAEARGLGALARMLDLSLLKFQDKDALVEVFQKWRTTVPYDMVKAWDARARKWYGDRYDFRRNMVDWDYHMRLQPAGTPGCDPAHGSIIHFHHFRHWRMHGVAHELRDSTYNAPNRSLLSTAFGRTKEFKDRTGKDVGRSVSAWGFWADALNGPFHGLGVLAEEPGFYKVTNKQFARTALDVAEHNVKALLHELRTGQRLALAEGAEPPRARAARGPTSLADLTAANSGRGEAEGKAEGKAEEGTAAEEAGKAGEGTAEGAAEAKAAGEGQQGEAREAGAGAGPSGQSAATGAGQAAAAASQPAGPSTPAPDPAAGPDPSPAPDPADGPDPAPAPAVPTPSAPSAPTYRSGGRAEVARAMAAAAAGGPGVGAAAAEGGERADAAPGAQGSAPASAPAEGTTAAAASTGTTAAAADAERMAAEEAALRSAEAALDAAGRARAERFRLVLLAGDLAKGVTGRPKFAGTFSALTLGHRHAHLLAPEHGLSGAAAPGALLVAENARHVLQLSQEQAAAFAGKMDEMALAAGWARAQRRPEGVTEASEVYVKPRGA